MHLYSFRTATSRGLAVRSGDAYLALTSEDVDFPGNLTTLVGGGVEQVLRAGEQLRSAGRPIDLAQVTLLPPVEPAKIVCVGLNYADHAAEADFAKPDYPAFFSRFASSLIASEAAILLPKESDKLDYEGELVAVIGRGGRRIARESALDHVVGYSIFNDASIRDYQTRSAQWTIGKNFDGTGAFGPALVTADALPPGGAGLAITTRVNGEVRQHSSTANLIFDVATLVALVSEAMTLEPGDIIVTGTPAGVGHARKPPVYMAAGDVCEVDIERIGRLRNAVVCDGRA